VLDEADVQNVARRIDALGQVFVGFAWDDVAGGVVVRHGKGYGIVFQCGTEDDANVDGGLCDAAGADALFPYYFVSLVEIDGPEFFVREVGYAGADVEEEVVAVGDDVFFVFALFFKHAVAQFEGGKDGDGFGKAKPFVAPL